MPTTGGAVRVLGRLGKVVGGARARGAGYCTVATCGSLEVKELAHEPVTN